MPVIFGPKSLERRTAEAATMATEVAMLAGGIATALAFAPALLAISLGAIDHGTLAAMIMPRMPIGTTGCLITTVSGCLIAIVGAPWGKISYLRGIVTALVNLAAAYQYRALDTHTGTPATTLDALLLVTQLAAAVVTMLLGGWLYARLCRRVFLT